MKEIGDANLKLTHPIKHHLFPPPQENLLGSVTLTSLSHVAKGPRLCFTLD